MDGGASPRTEAAGLLRITYLGEDALRWVAFGAEVFLYGLALLLYHFAELHSILLPGYSLTVFVGLCFSLLASFLCLRVFRGTVQLVIVVLVRTALVCLVAYPFASWSWGILALHIGLLIEISSLFGTSVAAFLSLASTSLVATSVGVPRWMAFSDGTYGLAALETVRFVPFGLFLLLAAGTSLAIRELLGQCRAQRKLVSQLNQNIDSLIGANLTFQQYADSAETAATQKERERITREIHDSSGYAFTNLIALLEVALSLGAGDLDRLTEVLYQAKTQAQEGLQETRQSLRKLRAARSDRPEGIKSLLEVLNTFERVTKVHVELQLGNTKWTYGQQIDSAIYRIIQEALTNSFRHGGAHTVWIGLWEQDGALIMNIRDDGKGAAIVTEGIGLRGMGERVGLLGGEIRILDRINGFRFMVRLPLKQEMH
jgi:signal transduction histidine kinase